MAEEQATLERIAEAYQNQLAQLTGQQGPQQGQPKEKSKRKASTLENVLLAPIHAIGKANKGIDWFDGFTASFLRSSAVSYTVASAIPYVALHPVIGAAYMAGAAAMSFYTSNAVFKVARGSLGLIFYPLRHPIDTIRKPIHWAANTVLHPFETLEHLIKLPFIGIKDLFTVTKKNKLGRTLGSMIGFGRGLYFAAPDIANNLLEQGSQHIAPMVDAAKEGIAGAYGKLSGLYGAYQLKEPLAPLAQAASGAWTKYVTLNPAF